MTQPDAYRMIQRRARAAGIKTKVGNHSMRATGITDYLKNQGTLDMRKPWPIIPRRAPLNFTTEGMMRFRWMNMNGWGFENQKWRSS